MHMRKRARPSLRSLFCNPSKKAVAVTIRSSHYSLPCTDRHTFPNESFLRRGPQEVGGTQTKRAINYSEMLTAIHYNACIMEK